MATVKGLSYETCYLKLGSHTHCTPPPFQSCRSIPTWENFMSTFPPERAAYRKGCDVFMGEGTGQEGVAVIWP